MNLKIIITVLLLASISFPFRQALAIVNGQEVSASHPLAKHVAEVQIVKDRATGIGVACTGVLVRSSAGNPSGEKTVAVLTAAHCFEGANADLPGSTFIRFGTVPNRASVVRPARAILFPPGLAFKVNDETTTSPDLALMQFQGNPPAGFEPIELAERPPRPGTLLTSLGYGLTGYGKQDSGILREGSLLFAFYDKMIKTLNSSPGEDPSGPQSACKGDSGGPLIAQTSSGPVLVGTLISGLSCESENKFGRSDHVNVADFRHWIETGFCDASCTSSNRAIGQAYSLLSKCAAGEENACHRLAAQGSAKAQYQVGHLMYPRSKDPSQQAQAIEWFRRAAEQGFPLAQLGLGRWYRNGENPAKNGEQALFWIQKAAATGLTEAQILLGVMFMKGDGVVQDHATAAYWFKKAAAVGDPIGQVLLGNAYYEGWGVAQNYTEAVYWMQKAAAAGEAAAQVTLGIFYAVGKGVAEDQQLAMSWFLKAAEQGYAGGQYELARSYWEGKGVRQDLTQAEYWMEKAASGGDKQAKEALPRLRQEIERRRAQEVGAATRAVLQMLNKP